jgi:L-aspartate oxidase
MKHIVVVGSGIAGLIAALEISRKHAVTLVTKAELSESNTRFAQGGIAAAMFDDDSVAEHIADTMRAGAGLNQLEAVEILCAEGPARISDLMALGVAFDRKDGELARGLEAAHSYPRVLHAGGDATGLAIETALVRAVRAANITVLEHTFACDLVLRDERVVGLDVLDAEGRALRLDADAVVLASGGAGQLYPYTTNPSVATGDGVAMALRAGAQLADVEFYQFHPTALAVPGNFLISEAVRGEGAVLSSADGERFMQRVHPAAELAPRDVVARGIAEQMAAQGGQPVLLDATALGAEFLAERFPTIDAACRRCGLDWSRQAVPVTPAAHYWMGGVRTDVWGRTSVCGLFAVGEVACTGVHGANRLASNSLLESLVFAWRAAQLLVEDDDVLDRRTWPVEDCDALSVVDDASAIVPVQRGELQKLMWDKVGIYRNQAGLREALAQLGRWEVVGDSVHDLETANLLALAKVIVRAALERRESRGAHYRNDFPEPSPALRRQLVMSHRVAVPC